MNQNNVYPLSNVNAKYVNADNSTWPGAFQSQATSRPFGYSGISNKVKAVDASKIMGGKKNNSLFYRRMNISKKWKNIMRTLFSCKKRKHKNKTKKGNMRGGYYQYGSNIPLTQTYSRGASHLSASLVGLANPAPFQTLPCTTNCVDNYSRFTNNGFQVLK
jgi:hypothetical protein